ncbi:hypothetical protein COCNU_15G006280 [Cocos nucifera]|uniref:Uncharacterized protein n=1 Tax=Cocos nucifera TaxID=13894 RepID=A0A8K0IZ62_COCNU|nr:hypothetical protein COCNU_15G006280 [Cocos nucifera]
MGLLSESFRTTYLLLHFGGGERERERWLLFSPVEAATVVVSVSPAIFILLSLTLGADNLPSAPLLLSSLLPPLLCCYAAVNKSKQLPPAQTVVPTEEVCGRQAVGRMRQRSGGTLEDMAVKPRPPLLGRPPRPGRNEPRRYDMR